MNFNDENDYEYMEEPMATMAEAITSLIVIGVVLVILFLIGRRG